LKSRTDLFSKKIYLFSERNFHVVGYIHQQLVLEIPETMTPCSFIQYFGSSQPVRLAQTFQTSLLNVSANCRSSVSPDRAVFNEKFELIFHQMNCSPYELRIAPPFSMCV